MSVRARVALVTEDRYEAPTPGHWYIDNILAEDAILSRALAAHGIEAERVSWSRASVEWSSFDAALLRTTWDYFDRFDEFSTWLAHLSAATRLLNPPSLVRWNLDKHYLRELDDRGVHAVPTEFVERGSSITLAELLRDHGSDELVIKPAISGAARHTYRIDASTAAAHESIFAELLERETMLVQPFLPSIVVDGEITLVVIDGQVTHGLRKRARPGDFRVQDDHGGTVDPHQPSAEEVELAERAIAACDPSPIYGRVDMVRDRSDRLAVMELELVEPELWFRLEARAAQRLAAALAREIQS